MKRAAELHGRLAACQQPLAAGGCGLPQLGAAEGCEALGGNKSPPSLLRAGASALTGRISVPSASCVQKKAHSSSKLGAGKDAREPISYFVDFLQRAQLVHAGSSRRHAAGGGLSAGARAEVFCEPAAGWVWQ